MTASAGTSGLSVSQLPSASVPTADVDAWELLYSALTDELFRLATTVRHRVGPVVSMELVLEDEPMYPRIRITAIASLTTRK